jgi:hypothetical protein
LKLAEKRVLHPTIICEEVLTSGEVRERIKYTVSKTRGREKEKRKKDSGDSEQLKSQAAIYT